MRHLRLGAVAALIAGGIALAGCGSGSAPAGDAPRLPAMLAHSLAAQANGVARLVDLGDVCGARTRALALQQAVIAAINERRVPVVYQEPLLGDVSLLIERIHCNILAPAHPTTSVPQLTTSSPSPPSPRVPPGHEKDHRHGEGRGHRVEEGH
ncbi:MAG: hypothetical protein ACXVY3_03350 [Gaiellaceae bacterium]